jgi:hypothetical protein
MPAHLRPSSDALGLLASEMIGDVKRLMSYSPKAGIARCPEMLARSRLT